MDQIFIIINLISSASENNFWLAILVFASISLIYNSFSLPGNILFMLFSGFLFGTYVGYLISILTISLGSFNFFLISKFVFYNFFPSIYKKYSSKIDTYIKNSKFEYLVIIRMIPGPPLMLQNFFLSLVNVSKLNFLFSTLLGLTPIIFITSFFGSKLKTITDIKSFNMNDVLTIDFFILILIIILLIFVKIYFKKK